MWNSPSSFMLCCANVLGLSEELVDLVAERENIFMAQSPKLKPHLFWAGAGVQHRRRHTDQDLGRHREVFALVRGAQRPRTPY